MHLLSLATARVKALAIILLFTIVCLAGVTGIETADAKNGDMPSPAPIHLPLIQRHAGDQTATPSPSPSPSSSPSPTPNVAQPDRAASPAWA